MFNALTEKFSNLYRQLSGQQRLTPQNIQDALRDVRTALLEADVALPVVKSFLEAVEARAIGQEVIGNLSPTQTLIKVVYEELVKLLGEPFSGVNLNAVPPAVILVAGLQGCGKTTTVAKLARWLKENQKKKILLASTDVYRPAAIEQLKVLASTIGVDFYSTAETKPLAIAKEALQQARVSFQDVLIIDTAGRLHIDDVMMDELKQIHQVLSPIETFYVADGMTGQDALLSTQAFHAALPLTGVILTKMDADSRGGAALSIRNTVGKPIKFLGVGEKTDALEPFHPERIASRILGMGDVLTLIEEAQSKMDATKAAKLQKKFAQGEKFTLEDFKDQLQQMSALGGASKILEKLPGISQYQPMIQAKMNDKNFKQMEAIIQSMTWHERHFPAVIRGGRKVRIAKGSGTTIQDVNRLLKQFEQAQKMSDKFSRKGAREKLMKKMQGFFP